MSRSHSLYKGVEDFQLSIELLEWRESLLKGVPVYVPSQDPMLDTLTLDSVPEPLRQQKASDVQDVVALQDRPICRFVTTGKQVSGSKLFVDDSVLAPLVSTTLSGNFQQAYRKQLDRLIHDDADKLSVPTLMSLAAVFSKYSSPLPTLLTSAKYVRRLRDIQIVLNSFFKTNHKVFIDLVILFNDEARPEVGTPHDAPGRILGR
ncbi:MAG: hypothetical protein PHN51_11935 [Candidatus Nanopelagicales bacterium]|nr:hypothetical protein [Candidatus Nanopelagicales bacterium]